MPGPRRLVLVRHGRSAIADDRAWHDLASVRRWRATYDTVGIADTSHPPAELLDVVARADTLVASDLPRAIASAERLGGGRAVTTSALLRETVLEIPRWVAGRWPLSVWEAAVHAHWGWRIVRGVDESDETRTRAIDAARWLGAVEGETIVAVTHGVFRRSLARQLEADGWRAAATRRGYEPWSAWRFAR